MKSSFFLFFTLTLTLILNACAPFVISGSSGEQPSPVVETQPAAGLPETGYKPVQVDEARVEVGVGSPIPVQVMVAGTLPDTCAQIELVQQKQAGSQFEITLSTVPSNAEGCSQDALPFRMEIPLNITNLPAGAYAVDVNGVSAGFQLETGNTTSSQPAAGSVVRKDDIPVGSLDVEVGVGSPLPVHAIVGMSLPDTCAQLGEIRLHREDRTFYVRLIADITERSDCREDSIPFLLKIPLSLVNVPGGPYEVNVNGTVVSFDPQAKPAADGDLAAFESRLQAALAQRDSAALQELMGERFIVAYWQSEGESVPSEEAAAQLLSSHIGPNSYLSFQDFQNIPAFDPQMFVGPDVKLAKAIYVTGWGRDGRGDALLFISRRPDGSLFWQGVMSTPKGFAPPGGQVCSEPVEVPVTNGRASYNGISFNIDGSLNFGMAARSCPSVIVDPQGGSEAHPPYTEFFFQTYSRQDIDFQPSIRVYEVVGDMQNYLYPLNSLDELQAALDQRPEPVTWFQHSPLHARESYLDFANGSGVRGLVQYMQDYFFYTNNGLIYEFNGLTQDGRHFVSVRYPVSVPFLMELSGISLPPNNINPSAIAVPAWPDDYDQQRKVIEAYNNEALRRFQQMADSDVLPDLVLLDQLVESMEVKRP